MALLLIRNLNSEVFQCDLVSDRVTLGRHADNDIPLNDPQISTFHAAFEKIEKGWRFTDLGSSNGSVLNGHRVLEAILKDRDLLTLGGCSIIYLEREEDIDHVDLPLSPHAIPQPSSEESASTDQKSEAPAPASSPSESKPQPSKQASPPVKPNPAAGAKPLSSQANIKNRIKQFKKRESDGCTTMIVIFIFAVVGFIAAISYRHHKETGRNFIVDLFSKAPVKIEIKQD